MTTRPARVLGRPKACSFPTLPFQPAFTCGPQILILRPPGTDSRLAASTRTRAHSRSPPYAPARLLVCERTPCCAQRTCTVQSSANADMCTCAQVPTISRRGARRPSLSALSLPRAARVATHGWLTTCRKCPLLVNVVTGPHPVPSAPGLALSQASLAAGPVLHWLWALSASPSGIATPPPRRPSPDLHRQCPTVSPLTHPFQSPPPPPHARSGRNCAAPTMSYCSA